MIGIEMKREKEKEDIFLTSNEINLYVENKKKKVRISLNSMAAEATISIKPGEMIKMYIDIIISYITLKNIKPIFTSSEMGDEFSKMVLIGKENTYIIDDTGNLDIKKGHPEIIFK